jgi:hypothetical protein
MSKHVPLSQRGLPLDRIGLDEASNGKKDFPTGRSFTVHAFFLNNRLTDSASERGTAGHRRRF